MVATQYKISTYSFQRAVELGVSIKPSTRKGKKIDVYTLNFKSLICSIGAIGYNDYPTYMELERNGKAVIGTAAQKRRNYKLRHQNNRKKVGTPGYFADKLLW
jgi:hypothetical protein